MQPHKLARVRWQVGQTLLPEHFRAQEGAFSAEARLYAELSGLPLVGVASLELSEVLLSEGTLSISAMSAVLPGGFLVEVPGNAVISPISLDDTGRANLTLYLHLMEETRWAAGVPLYAEDQAPVGRVLHTLLLSTDQAVDGAVSTLTLASLAKNPEGKWKLSALEVPPLLLVGPNPFLDTLLHDLDAMLAQAQGQLRTQLQDSYLRSDRLTNARRTLCEVRAVQALRADMKNGVFPHPYACFAALRRLYFESCCYLEVEPDEQLPSYQHDDLGPGLRRWADLLDRSFRPEATRLTHRSFACRDGRFILSPLPKEEPPANEFYLLVQRKDPSAALSLEGVKLASPLRLPSVRRLALKGIPFRNVAHPAFPHAFGPEIDWYQLTSGGEEWQYALREDGIAFYVTPAIEKAQISLFWRRQ